MNFKEKPFYLQDEDIAWVQETLENMSEEEKIGQLFCLIAYSDDEAYINKLLGYHPGGLMCRMMPAKQAVNIAKLLQENSAVPMLISANLERGADGILEEGTSFGSQMQVAATDDEEMAEKLGMVCARESMAVGANWAFAPIIDIDYNFRSPITNTRTLGSDPDRVRRMGIRYVKAVQGNGMAASIKHFPGDGMDERDQHLVTTINSMSCEEWDETYGKVYQGCIDAGAMTVMVGHIMHPAYSRKFCPDIRDEDILPASLSPELVTGLLKEKLGFQGLVATDASTMSGMMIPMDRKDIVPRAIAAGCDMFMFAKNIDEDFEYMRQGIADGIITKERLDEAVSKILALKAALKLPQKKASGKLVPDYEDAIKQIGTQQHQAWAKECADKGITLVKEEKGVLPVSPDKHKRILFYDIANASGPGFTEKTGAAELFLDLLKKEGFEVDTFVPNPAFEGFASGYREIKEKYDLLIYLAHLETKSNQTTVRIEWAQPMGANVPMYINTVPTIFISTENPYHLLDVPRVKTFINTYGSNETTIRSLVDKLLGRSEFTGISPVDAFCGKWDTRL